MNSKETNLIAETIVSSVKNERTKLYALLLKNGVVLPSNASDKSMSMVVSELLKKSKSFRKDFTNLVQNSDSIAEEMTSYSNFDFKSYTVAPTLGLSNQYKSTTTDTTTTTPDSSSTSSFWSASNLANLFNQQLNNYITLDTNKTNRKLAEATIKTAGTKETVDDEGSSNKPPKKESNTTLYVILGILGVAVIGGAIWYVSKNKK